MINDTWASSAQGFDLITAHLLGNAGLGGFSATQGGGATQGWGCSVTQGGGCGATQGGGCSVTQGGGCGATQGGGCSVTQGGGCSATQGGGCSVTQGGGCSATQGGGCSATRDCFETWYGEKATRNTSALQRCGCTDWWVTLQGEAHKACCLLCEGQAICIPLDETLISVYS
jgi:hypothetical protein